MHRSATSSLARQASVGHIARTDTDTKCAKARTKEVGDKAASKNDAARNRNQLVCKEPQPIGEGIVPSSMTCDQNRDSPRPSSNNPWYLHHLSGKCNPTHGLPT